MDMVVVHSGLTAVAGELHKWFGESTKIILFGLQLNWQLASGN